MWIGFIAAAIIAAAATSVMMELLTIVPERSRKSMRRVGQGFLLACLTCLVVVVVTAPRQKQGDKQRSSNDAEVTRE